MFLSSSCLCAFASGDSLARVFSRSLKVARSDIIFRSSSRTETLCSLLQGSETIRGVICATVEVVKQIDANKNDPKNHRNSICLSPECLLGLQNYCNASKE